jgi:phage minor structural protein
MLYFFNNQEKLIGYIDSESSLSVIQTEPLRGVIVLEASVIDGYSELLEASTYVGHVDAVNDDSFQLYRIKSISLGDGNVGAKISAQHVVFDELSSRDIIRKVSFNGLNMSAAFMEILKESRWKLGECNVNKSVNLSAENTNVSKLITTLINKYSIELRYRLKFANNKIIGRFIDVFENRGRNTHKRYAYGHNALSVVKEVDSNNLYTAIIPHGKEIEQSEEERKAKKEKQKLDITKVAWSKLNGNYVDKKIGEDILELKELSQIYGFSDGSPRTMFKNYDIDDENELIKTAYEDLVNLARPKVQFSAKIEDLGELDIGDSIVIIRSDLGIYYRTRVIEIKRNLIEYGLSELVLGDNLDLKNPQKSTNRLSKQISDLETQINNINVETNKVKDSLKDTSFLDDLRKQLKDGMYDHDSYNYFLKKGNEYGLPPGFYAFNKPIDQNPTSGIWMNGGKMAIANKRNADGTLNWSTWLNGEGIIADYITAGILQGGKVRWNLEDGTFLIGNSINDYSFYWDGSTLHMSDVDIDLTNNSVVKNMNQNIDKNNEDIKKANDVITQTQTSVKVLKDSISSKVSKTEILSDKEIQNALKGRDGADGTNGSNFTWNMLLKSNVGVENDKYNISNYDLSGDFVVGENYTLTIWGKLGEDRTRFDFYNSESYVRLEGATEIRQGVYSVSFKWKDTREYNGVVHKGDNSKLLVYAYSSSGKSTSRIDKIKLEKGINTNPVWSPHISEINGKDGVDGKDGTFTGEIGGRNLIRNSDKITGWTKYDGGNHLITDEYIEEFNIQGQRIRSDAANATDFIKTYVNFDVDDLIVGKNYTFSVYVKNNRDVPAQLRIQGFDWNFAYELQPSECKRFVVTGKREKMDGYWLKRFQLQLRSTNKGQFVDMTVARPQLEEGDVATSWKPNPLDLISETQTVKRTFEAYKEQTEKALTDKVSITSYNANNQQIQQQISNVTQTANSITQRVSNIDKRTSDLATKYSQVKQTTDSITSTVSSAQGAISKLKADASFQKALTDQNYTDLRSRISSIKQTTDSITLTVSSKLGKTEVQSLIKQTVDNITIKASQIDFSGNVSITGELRTKYYSGNTALWMKNDSLKAYEDNSYNSEIGYFGGRKWSGETYPYHLSISHGMDYHTTISYEGSSNYHPYILFDAYNNVDPSFVDSSGNATIRKHQYDPVGGIKYMMRELHTERNYFTDKVFHQDHVWVQKDLYFGNGVGIERAGRDDYVVFGEMSQVRGVASGGLRFMNNGRVYTEGSVFVNNEIRWNANYPIFFGNGYGVQLTNSYIAIGRITSDGTVTDGIYIEGTELRALRDNQLGATLN